MKKNILLYGYNKNLENFVTGLYEKKKVNELYWISHSKRDQKNLLNNTKILFFNNYDLCRLDFKIDIPYVKSLPTKLIEIIYSELPVLVDMLSRFEILIPSSNLNKTTYIFDQFRFWYNFILCKEINVYIHFDTPHDVYDYIIYSIFKFLKKKIIILQQSSFYIKNNTNQIIQKFTITPTNDLKTGQIIVRSKKYISDKDINFSKVKKAYSLDDINSAFTERSALIINKNKNNFIFKIYEAYRSNLLKENYIIKDFDQIEKRLNIFEFYVFRKKVHMQTYKFKNFVNNNSIRLDEINSDFVFFPLQYQPERTSCPEGKFYSNQFLALVQLRDNLDKKITIIIKEHPKQLKKETIKNQINRSLFFYKKLISLENVKLIKNSIPSKNVLSHNRLIGVATIKGNIILESVMNNIPAFLFGNSIWRKIEQVHDASSSNVLKNINKILAKKIIFNQLQFKNDFEKCLAGSFISSKNINEPYCKKDRIIFEKYLLKLIDKKI